MKEGYPIVRPPLPAGVRLDENVYVKMRDGVKIAVDIYRPAAEGRYPALLSMSPYIKEIQQWPPVLTHSIEAGATSFFVSKGYVHVIAQIRGTGFSQGQWNLFDIKEQRDGYDLVEWIAQQPWCDGNVGMHGDSYFAIIQYLVAAQKPPHLKCIVPYDGWTDLYRDFCYQGGSTMPGLLVCGCLIRFFSVVCGQGLLRENFLRPICLLIWLLTLTMVRTGGRDPHWQNLTRSMYLCLA